MKSNSKLAKWKTLHPILEQRYMEQNKLYLYGDADDTTFSYVTAGQIKMDIKKWGSGIVAFSVILLLFLRHRK